MNVDDIKSRYEPRENKVYSKNNDATRAEIEQHIKEFLKKKGKIQVIESCISSDLIDFKTHLSQQANAGKINKQ